MNVTLSAIIIPSLWILEVDTGFCWMLLFTTRVVYMTINVH